MKQLLVLSGKGGTGKTTIASAFIELGQAKAYADCDVDAPNLHLVSKHKELKDSFDYLGMHKAFIDQETCVECSICSENCRFDAIVQNKVDVYACEGCGLCAHLCPHNAIEMVENKAGRVEIYRSEAVFSTAKLKMGEGNSGLLVTEVKKQLKPYQTQVDFAVIDGSPGIGCSVIASLAGVDLVLVVAEPTISGMSDMIRVLEVALRMGVKAVVCINKYDMNLKLTEDIESHCLEKGIPFLGGIPYDADAMRLVNKGRTIVSDTCPSGEATKRVFEKVRRIMNE